MLGFLKKELIQLLRDPIMLIAILVMPVVEVIVLSQAITLEARNLRLAIDAPAEDTVLNRIYDHAIGSGWFQKTEPMEQSALKAVQNGRADVALVAPKGGLTKALQRGEGNLQVLIDATNVLKAQSVESYLTGIIAQTIQEELHQTPTGKPLFSVRILFNPQLDTQLFIVPAIMSVLVFMSLLTLTAISITKEKENGTIEMLISAPVSKYRIIFGKVIPFTLVALINMFLIQSVGVIMFHLPFNGNFWMFIGAFLVFVIPSAAAGVLLSTYAKTQQQAMLGMMIVAFLALMLSGSMFPIENMPLILQGISYLNPLTHYTFLVRNIILKGCPTDYFLLHTSAMAGLGIILSIWAAKRFKTTL